MDKTILIVDDMMLNIEMLSNILEEDYDIMTADSGENAIEQMQCRIPDLVLLDIYMPGMDGFEVLRFMREDKDLSTIPVIFVTGEHDENSEEKGLRMGAVDYIKKPYNALIARIKVRNHLEMKAYRDSLKSLVYMRTMQLEERTKQLAASREAIIMGMSLMSESHDKVTGSHIERIKDYTRILVQKMLTLYPDIMTPDLADQIALYSPLHDVGKISISDVILNKAGALTPEEFDTIKAHTLEGASLLRKTEAFLTDSSEAGGLSVAIEIAECHHERYDGTGYPHGMKGEDIPIAARIVSVADVYDALKSTRPYKKAFTHEEAMDIILTGDAKTKPCHFDPKVLEILQIVDSEFRGIN